MEDANRFVLPASIKSNRKPLHTQVVEALMGLLEQGIYTPGDMLPSEDALAKQLGISRSTLREALGYLETHGLVYRKHGIGTFVGAPVQVDFMSGVERLESFRSLAARAGIEVEVAERDVEMVEASPQLATSLGIEPGTNLVLVQIVESIKGRRTVYLNTYVRSNFADVEELTEFRGSVIDYLTQRDGLNLSHTRSEILAVHADECVAAMLQIPPGTAVLHLLEVYYASDGEPVAISLNYFLTDRFHYYLIRRVPLRGRGGRHSGGEESR